MPQLLLELFSEEIPSGLQIRAAEQLKEAIAARFSVDGLPFKKIAAYATPRRIAVVVDGMESAVNDSEEERRGPRIDAPEKALEGFCKSTGLNISDLEKRKTEKGEFYFAIIKKEGGEVSDVIQSALHDILCNFTWPKSMKWGENNIRWIRPLHNILCIFNEKEIPVKFGHLQANNKSFGHRFLSPKEFEVKDFADYEKKLEKNFVILDTQKRKEVIKEDADKLAKSCGLTIKNDESLLDEVAGLVEWPVVLLGRIEDKFMSVPQEVLITAMRSHQKYFSLLNTHGNLAPYFITVSNIKSEDSGARITNGNERVLRARLEDAKFFWDTDRRNSLESRIPDLEKIVFHAKLGTVAQKVERMSELAKILSVWIPHANLISVERAARLSKTDLVTEMVGEFPELQGLMGCYYAIESGEKKEVSDAIKEHYSPLGPNDECPTEPVSVAVALADKIDTLIGLFAVNEKPTGSKDPYALRRAALGVIRIILENNLRIPLKLLFERAINKYPKSLLKPKKAEGRKLLSIRGKESAKVRQDKIINELLEFFADRIKVLLKEKDIRHDLIMAVFDGGSEDDIGRLVNRVTALSDFINKKDGQNLSAAYKRATNIVMAEEKKHNTEYEGDPERELLEAEEEKKVYDLFHQIKPLIESSLKDEQYEKVMLELAKLREPIDQFFEKVTVNADNENVRKNRLLLLGQFRQSLNKVANFSKIEG